MARRLPSLNALRAFEAAGRHLSFARAAEELAVTPTAISHQIRHLEATLGAKLFRRLTRRLLLTDEGQALLADSRAAFDRLAQAVERLRGLGESGRLAVSSAQTFAWRFLVPRLARFQAAHPGIEVRIEASQRLVDFRREDVDVGIRYGDGAWPGLAAVKLYDDRVTPLYGPALLKAGETIRAPADLLRYPLLSDDVNDDEEWRRWFSAAGVEKRAPIRGPAFDSSQMAVQAAVAGMGVCLVRPEYFTDELDSGRLVRPFAVSETTGRGHWFVCPEARAGVPKIAAFRAWLLAELAAEERAPGEAMRVRDGATNAKKTAKTSREEK